MFNNSILFDYFTKSIIMIIFILGMCIMSFYLNRKYIAKVKYYMWLMIALYLIFPFQISIKNSLFTVVISDKNIITIHSDIFGEETFMIINDNSKEWIVNISSEVQKIYTQNRTLNWIKIINIIWIMGIILLIVYEIGKYNLYNRYIYRWSKKPREKKIFLGFNKVVEDMGIKSQIPILISDKVSSPLMSGFIYPHIYLPQEDYSSDDLELILRHELTHYKRYDLWYKLILIIAKAIHWYNPFVYLMCRQANADLERSCDDIVLNGKEYKYRKAYSEVILSTIKKQRAVFLTTYFYGDLFIMKERFRNILNTKKKKNNYFALCILCLCIIIFNSLVDYKRILMNDTNCINRIDNLQKNKNSILQTDYQSIFEYSRNFINLFNGSIANKETIDLSNYIYNKNLLEFANKMIEITQKQNDMGKNSIIYGEDNEFGDAKIVNKGMNLYYVKVPFSYQGSGMNCQLLLKLVNSNIEIVDFYFGSQDGIDTIATGHHTERMLDNPEKWNDENWVMSVYEKILIYEESLNQ